MLPRSTSCSSSGRGTVELEPARQTSRAARHASIPHRQRDRDRRDVDRGSPHRRDHVELGAGEARQPRLRLVPGAWRHEHRAVPPRRGRRDVPPSGRAPARARARLAGLVRTRALEETPRSRRRRSRGPRARATRRSAGSTPSRPDELGSGPLARADRDCARVRQLLCPGGKRASLAHHLEKRRARCSPASHLPPSSSSTYTGSLGSLRDLARRHLVFSPPRFGGDNGATSSSQLTAPSHPLGIRRRQDLASASSAPQRPRRERLARDPVEMREQVGIRRRNGQPDPIGELEARLLAQGVDRVDELVDPAFALELCVDVGVERDGDAVLGGERPALPAVRSTSTSSRFELVAGSAEAAVTEILELAALQRRTDGGEPFPSFGPSSGQVRLDPQLAASTSPNVTSLTRSSSRDLLGVRPCERRAVDDEAWQRLTKLHARGRAGLTAELDDASHVARPRRASARPASAASGQPAWNTDAGASAHERSSVRQRCRRGTASPARSPGVPGRARTRASRARPRRRPRIDAASGGCTSSRRRRRRRRTRDDVHRQPALVGVVVSATSAACGPRASIEPLELAVRPVGDPPRRASSPRRSRSRPGTSRSSRASAGVGGSHARDRIRRGGCGRAAARSTASA